MFLSVGFPVPSPQICSHVPVLLVTWVPPTWPAAAHSWRQAQDTIQFSHHTGERLLCGKCADLVCAHLVSVGGVTCVCLARIPWQWGCTGSLSAPSSDLLLFPAQAHLHLHSTVLTVKHWKEIYMEPSRV